MKKFSYGYGVRAFEELITHEKRQEAGPFNKIEPFKV
jgi:hypothetical protein